MRPSGNFNGLMAAIGLVFATAAGIAFAADPEAAPKAFHDAYKPPTYELDPVAAKRGGEVYNGVCGACHEQGLNRAPQRYMISLMTPESIRRALTDGVTCELAGKHIYYDDWANIPIGTSIAGPEGCNYAVRTGSASDIFVVDCDNAEATIAFIEKYDPQTFTVKTGRGYHFYFRLPTGITVRNSASRLMPKVDIPRREWLGRGTGVDAQERPGIHGRGRHRDRRRSC